MKLNRRLKQILFLVYCTRLCVPAHADGIDAVAYLTRAGDGHSVPAILGIVLCLMLANYVLNYFVIGLPAIEFGHADSNKVRRDLISLTLWGQAADRIGAVAAPLVLGFFGILTYLLKKFTGINLDMKGGVSSVVTLLLCFNFLLSGLAVGALSFQYLNKRWRISRRTSYKIALAAAVFTNPAWALALWFI